MTRDRFNLYCRLAGEEAPYAFHIREGKGYRRYMTHIDTKAMLGHNSHSGVLWFQYDCSYPGPKPRGAQAIERFESVVELTLSDHPEYILSNLQ